MAAGAEPTSIDASGGKPYVPEKYNTKTALELTVSDSGQLEHDFDLAM